MEKLLAHAVLMHGEAWQITLLLQPTPLLTTPGELPGSHSSSAVLLTLTSLAAVSLRASRQHTDPWDTPT